MEKQLLFCPQMMIRQICNGSSPGRTEKKSFLNQIRFINIFNGSWVFPNGCCQSIQTYRPSCKFFNNSGKQQPVCLIQPISVHFQKVHSKVGHVPGNLSVIFHFGKNPYSLQKSVGKTRSSSETSGHLQSPFPINLLSQYPSRVDNNLLKLFFRIE